MAIALNQRLIDVGTHCYNEFLSKKYQLTDKERFPKEGDYNGYVIQRPNHGLVHTLRKIYYFPLVMTIFHLNGITTFDINGTKFKIQDEVENMLTAYFFSVVGRESEASHKEDPKNYASFRKKSADSYQAYILKHYQKIPLYQDLVTSKKITFYRNLIESPHANKDCIASRIFRICHCLDLLRCYKESEYTASLAGIKSELGIEELQKKMSTSIIDELKTYAIACLKATGDQSIAFQIPRSAQLFVPCSIDVKTCAKVLSGVALPSFMAPKKEPAKPIAVPQAKAVSSNSEEATLKKYENAKLLLSQKDYQKALTEFQALSISGFAKGSYQIGICYYQGLGVKVDYNTAYTYLYSAAQSKHPQSLYMVGLCAYYGHGCPKDLERSKKYFNEAVKYNSLEAKDALNKLFK